FLLEREAGPNTTQRLHKTDKALPQLSMEWQVIDMTTQALLLRRHFSSSELTALIERRLQLRDVRLSPEEQLAWHDLVEAFWATGYLADAGKEFVKLFSALQELERNHMLPSQRLLAELAWRMAIQSHCLTGYGRWEAPAGSTDRGHYDLPPDSGREAMARLWTAWFHGCRNDVKEVARQARKANPPGSELYVAALEAEWLITNIDIETRLADDDDLHRRQEFRDAMERDDTYKLINSTVTSLLDVNLEPKKEGTIYLGGRGAESPRCEAILGERVALRRWYLASWHKVVGYNVRTMLSLAHTMSLEGDKVVQPILDAVRSLPWGIPYVGKSMKLLESLLPQVEPHITADDLAPVLGAIARSPRRIGNIRHPGLKILGDAVAPEMIPLLVEWTLRELQDPNATPWPGTFEVWPELMEHMDLSAELWQRLTPLLNHALECMFLGDANMKIVREAIARAPWSIASPLVRRIADLLCCADSDPCKVGAAKEAVIAGLLSRRHNDWYGSEEHRIILEVLRHLVATGRDPNDRIWFDLVDRPYPPEGHELVAERWLEILEFIRSRAMAREKTRDLSFGDTPAYLKVPSGAISDEMALRACRALDDLWAAENATLEEIWQGTSLAGYLFAASVGAGRQALARSLLSAMGSNRTAIGFLGISRQNCAPLAWRVAALHSAHFPTGFLTELVRLLELVELPLDYAWTQARLAMEVLLRSESSEEKQHAQSILLRVRARTAEHPRSGATSLVMSVGRMLEEPQWPPALTAILELFIAWTEDAAYVPDPELRESVAKICGRLLRRFEGPNKDRLTKTMDRLRKDVRMRVRKAAEDVET
ncbi:MAG: hypothetical protein H5T62_16920, partial [Anaerolineae bacterium]|nr:hypothetical protein [Anaerolineae bacterium]